MEKEKGTIRATGRTLGAVGNPGVVVGSHIDLSKADLKPTFEEITATWNEFNNLEEYERVGGCSHCAASFADASENKIPEQVLNDCTLGSHCIMKKIISSKSKS